MTLLTLFWEFFKIGLFCFGGAFGMIPLIRQTVLEHGWLTESRFYELVGICESTPGPIAVNMATYVGATQAGVAGSLAATLGVVLPSFLIILLVASVLKGLTDNRYFKGFIKGVKPVVAGLILSTGASLLIKSFGGGWLPIVIFGALCAVWLITKYLLKKKLSSVAIILIAAAMGIVAACIV